MALLTALLQLRAELGIVLSVAHVNHGIRPEANADACFVAELAKRHGVALHLLRADVPDFARKHRIGLEAAGRAVRYGYFEQLISSGVIDKVATAHTLDDQAETVLLRLIRGAGLQGVAGILVRRALGGGEVIRPLLGTSRVEIIEYLQSQRQDWREDATNSDVTLARNRVRHELLPMLEQNYNPAIREALVNLSDIARADSNYLGGEASRVFDEVWITNSHDIRVEDFLKLPLALQRQLLMTASERFLQHRLEFAEVEDLRRTAAGEISGRQLNKDCRVVRVRGEHGHVLRFLCGKPDSPPRSAYEFSLCVPGEVAIAALNSVVRARLIELNDASESYNPAELLDPDRLQPQLVLRNYRPGDRFHPLHRQSEEKLKRLFLEKKIPRELRSNWPVLVSGSEIVWVRGFAVSAEHAVRPGSARGVLVDEVQMRDTRTRK